MQRLLVILAALVIGLLPATVASAAPSAALVQADQGKAKGHDKDKPGHRKNKDKSKNRGNHGNGKGRENAPGQLKKAPTVASPGNGNSNGNGPNDASVNENKKITYCHVPPGNPANGHLITTSVNAIDPGHANHPGDIIPPFSFVKHGETVSFPGQNWDAEGRATLANGCKAAGAALAKTLVDSKGEGAVKSASLTAAGDERGQSGLDAILPDTGGARIVWLLVGAGLLAAGVTILARRRGTT